MSLPSDEIFIEGMELFGYVGVLEKEKLEGQVFVVDVRMSVDLSRAGKSDMLRHTVNYAEVYKLAELLMTRANCDLIETYAEGLADAILKSFSLARDVTIRVRKPNAPIEGRFRSVGITLHRARHG